MRLLVVVIGAVTLLSGAAPLFLGGRALGMMGLPVTAASLWLFTMVNVLVMVFGAALLHAVIRREVRSAAVLWVSVQKLASAASVAMGVASGLLKGGTVWVAAYDALAGCVVLWYWIEHGKALTQPADR